MQESIDVCAEKEDEDDDGEFEEPKYNKKKKARKSSQNEVCIISESKGKWEKTEAGVDSCAADNVCPVNIFPDIEKKESEASRNRKVLCGSKWRRDQERG